jgi:hypothetical protein
METVQSKNDVPIRLPDERWIHITEEHSELAGYYFEVLETVNEPQAVYEGKLGELIAVKQLEIGKFMVVVYKEVSKGDGFIITAFLTKRIRQIERRNKLWPL